MDAALSASGPAGAAGPTFADLRGRSDPAPSAAGGRSALASAGVAGPSDPVSRAATAPSDPARSFTLACALASEERAARRGGARAARVGLRACLELPPGPLVAFGLAGALVPGLSPGDLVSATRIVTPDGTVVWEGEPVRLAGARPATVCAADRVVDDPGERAAIAERTGALAVEMESAVLAASGRLAGCVRAIADAPGRRVGRLGVAATAEGGVRWGAVVAAFVLEPRRAARAARDASAALAALERAAAELAASPGEPPRATGGPPAVESARMRP